MNPTTFASCEHPAGQVMWTEMRRKRTAPSGDCTSGKGEGASCVKVPCWAPPRGGCSTNPTALATWRSASATPATSAEDCPGGAATEDTFGCVKSSSLAPPSEVGGSGAGAITFNKTVVLPPATACVSQTSLKIALKDPKYDPLTEVVVKIGSKKVADVKGIKTIKKGITLKKLPSGTYKISVRRRPSSNSS